MRNPFGRWNKKDKLANGGSQDLDNVVPDEFRPPGAGRPPLFPPTRGSEYLLAHLPPKVLERIFTFVCPHARDECYETCEGSASASDSECMLCNLRDLAHCVQVSRAWRANAVKKRKKTSRFDRNGVPEDPAQARLRLLRRTVRDDPTHLGKLVQYLKIPYMLRESSQVELAHTIAVLPNLRYIDLPEGMFCDDPSFATLRLEVQARCPNLRKMTYVGGSERSFAMLASRQVWPCIEVLELNNLNIGPMTIRAVLGSLTNLQGLKVSETPGLSDEVLSSADGMSTLPPLKELVLKDTPRVTLRGIIEYLAWQETQQALRVLTLKDTSVHPASLQEILDMASSLKTLAIQTKVVERFPGSSNIRPLASRSLETLRFEISGSSSGPFSSVTMGYYTYLASSILSVGFPRLRRLYVHDDTFPDQLQGLPPPNAAFAGGHVRSSSDSSSKSTPGFNLSPASANLPPFAPSRPVSKVSPNTKRFSSNNPFARVPSSPPLTHTLEVFTKSDEFGKWNFARVDPLKSAAAPPRRDVSSYGLAADVTGSGWEQEDARRSVMIGNGAGGFLAVPGLGSDDDSLGGGLSEQWRLQSSGGEAQGSRDLWR
ncbi:hypothetical protein B0J13DRAFT_504662 [Dactylonectria estremocensis]|uniref:F-box domain-containing protein n=1 Tax=Dactylonectria estremocensis TaxID=1079267 RepID=A0A9P9EML4_9HYPO|nr:hypothetical protein B0J13DRAFT_504662 [Dactylonectria estremocensis]